MTGVGTLSAAGKASKAKILADPFVKWLGSKAPQLVLVLVLL